MPFKVKKIKFRNLGTVGKTKYQNEPCAQPVRPARLAFGLDSTPIPQQMAICVSVC